ncbi:MAG: site-2 protease family protein [Gammaproteobacteria bacterium]|nr:site-2 protease family protein [Gammaproteobacteria bacterium]MCW5582463.1 site-2 protease family protein [Gammaproteobacteria bacterium]
MTDLTTIQKIVVWALPLIFAITLHEVAHGYVASLFGDQTARYSGRLTLNPIKHIDMLGTIMVPFLMLMVSNFIFGWAKPVPVDPRNLRNPRRDMAIVALAGPLSNLLMALFWGLIMKIGLTVIQQGNGWLGVPLAYMGNAGVLINVVLGVLNLIPLPPLDGGRVLSAVLPPRMAYSLHFIEPYGFIILILLMLSGILFSIMGPFVFLIVSTIRSIFGL